MMNNGLLTFDQLPESFKSSVREKSRADADREERQQQFKKRSGLFTASEVHKLFTAAAKPAQNATARGYICEKAWERMTGGRVSKGGMFKETSWGEEFEVEAIEAFMKETGHCVRYYGDKQVFQKASGFPFGATLDGVIGNDEITEVKCPYNGGIHIQNLRYASDIEWFIQNRMDYYIQIQGGLWASDRKKGWFISYDPGCSRERNIEDRVYFEGFDKNLFYTEIPRDETFIDNLKRVVSAAEKELQAIVNE